jgi:hypothetical protein
MIIVALMYSALIMGALWANNRVEPTNRWPVRMLRLFSGSYLLIVGMLALDRYFAKFSETPYRLGIALIPPFIGILFLSFHPLTLRWIREIPQRWLIGLQTFRALVALEFFFLNKDGVLPRVLTFRGGNFDNLIGISAPFVAWYVHKLHRRNKSAARLVTIWNIVGLILLTDTVTRGLLAMPTKFQYFTEKPDNIGMAFFPWIWIPTFVVPLAYLLHILSLRREWAFRKRGYKSRLDSALGNEASIR